jgi:hypothetical protein
MTVLSMWENYTVSSNQYQKNIPEQTELKKPEINRHCNHFDAYAQHKGNVYGISFIIRECRIIPIYNLIDIPTYIVRYTSGNVLRNSTTIKPATNASTGQHKSDDMVLVIE